jgi:hypothetical protein
VCSLAHELAGSLAFCRTVALFVVFGLCAGASFSKSIVGLLPLAQWLDVRLSILRIHHPVVRLGAQLSSFAKLRLRPRLVKTVLH